MNDLKFYSTSGEDRDILEKIIKLPLVDAIIDCYYGSIHTIETIEQLDSAERVPQKTNFLFLNSATGDVSFKLVVSRFGNLGIYMTFKNNVVKYIRFSCCISGISNMYLKHFTYVPIQYVTIHAVHDSYTLDCVSLLKSISFTRQLNIMTRVDRNEIRITKYNYDIVILLLSSKQTKIPRDLVRNILIGMLGITTPSITQYHNFKSLKF